MLRVRRLNEQATSYGSSPCAQDLTLTGLRLLKGLVEWGGAKPGLLIWTKGKAEWAGTLTAPPRHSLDSAFTPSALPTRALGSRPPGRLRVAPTHPSIHLSIPALVRGPG